MSDGIAVFFFPVSLKTSSNTLQTVISENQGISLYLERKPVRQRPAKDFRVFSGRINRDYRGFLMGTPYYPFHLKSFLKNLPLVLPAALRAIRLPTLPFLTALMSPKILAKKYNHPLVDLLISTSP